MTTIDEPQMLMCSLARQSATLRKAKIRLPHLELKMDLAMKYLRMVIDTLDLASALTEKAYYIERKDPPDRIARLVDDAGQHLATARSLIEEIDREMASAVT